LWHKAPVYGKLIGCWPRPTDQYLYEEVRTLPRVEIRSNESPEQLLRRFNKTVIKSKVLGDIRRKRWFISKSELSRIEKKKAVRRMRKTLKPGE
jgi:small subunit ribosomal protein S21